MYHGIAIKLCHGVLIGWDGRLVRHCTSMIASREGNVVYGTFFASKTRVVKHGMSKLQQEIYEQHESKVGAVINPNIVG